MVLPAQRPKSADRLASGNSFTTRWRSRGRQKEKVPVCPDAFFTIEKNNDPKTRLSYALEADRGTTTRRTFDDKINAYWRFLEQNRQIRAYGVKWFRVVTITLTNARANSLADIASQTIPDRLRKYFLFASRENFSQENQMPFMKRFTSLAKNRNPTSLIP
jgi:hypothetical protein